MHARKQRGCSLSPRCSHIVGNGRDVPPRAHIRIALTRRRIGSKSERRANQRTRNRNVSIPHYDRQHLLASHNDRWKKSVTVGRKMRCRKRQASSADAIGPESRPKFRQRAGSSYSAARRTRSLIKPTRVVARDTPQRHWEKSEREALAGKSFARWCFISERRRAHLPCNTPKQRNGEGVTDSPHPAAAAAYRRRQQSFSHALNPRPPDPLNPGILLRAAHQRPTKISTHPPPTTTRSRKPGQREDRELGSDIWSSFPSRAPPRYMPPSLALSFTAGYGTQAKYRDSSAGQRASSTRRDLQCTLQMRPDSNRSAPYKQRS